MLDCNGVDSNDGGDNAGGKLIVLRQVLSRTDSEQNLDICCVVSLLIVLVSLLVIDVVFVVVVDVVTVSLFILTCGCFNTICDKSFCSRFFSLTKFNMLGCALFLFMSLGVVIAKRFSFSVISIHSTCFDDFKNGEMPLRIGKVLRSSFCTN